MGKNVLVYRKGDYGVYMFKLLETFNIVNLLTRRIVANKNFMTLEEAKKHLRGILRVQEILQDRLCEEQSAY